MLGGAPDGPEPGALLVRERDFTSASKIPGAGAVFTDANDFLKADLDVVVECASAPALLELAPRLLAEGRDVIPLSLGAFADPSSEACLVAAACKGPGRMEIPAGAMGSIGFLAAAREHGLREVTMKIAYPIERWRGMGAGRFARLKPDKADTFMRASVREVSQRFSGHLNVAIGVALAGLGLDHTQVELISDPGISQARFEVRALSNSGPVYLRVDGRDAPVEDDPLDYTTFSVIRLLRRRCAHVAI